MNFEIEILPLHTDLEAERVKEEVRTLGLPDVPGTGRLCTSRFFLLSGNLDGGQVRRVAAELLTDWAVEEYRLRSPGEGFERTAAVLNVLLKPGVMDPTSESVEQAIADLGLPATRVRTGRRYYFGQSRGDTPVPHHQEYFRTVAERVLANDAIEQTVIGPLPESAWSAAGSPYQFRLVVVPIRQLGDVQLLQLSRDGQLYLNLEEMRTIQRHFRELGRDPTDVELETLAQTWSEHCSHKTLKGRIDYSGPDGARHYDNLLKETIFRATQEIRRRLGPEDWCVSVFEDNAGVVRFDDQHHVCFKVETHNHPSAIEPYGGANTGLGGVIRDVLGTGLGGRPVCNTDVFCFAPPDYPVERLPAGVLHPRRVMRGVVAGVRDYGNRMGIPTVNGAICFDERYLGNPLVYCGTVGLIPVGKESKHPRAGDLIVAVGGRTGRDGIHGATFSSAELTHDSEAISGGAVQIGNPITEKKLLDVILAARDRGLYSAITDCGAGGFSSAVGEMGAEIGARVDLEKAPLKYAGLSYTEIWISESQERMVLAVPPERWPELHQLCRSEDVEATVLGQFEATGRLALFYQGNEVGKLDMGFLHHGRPAVVRRAEWKPAPRSSAVTAVPRESYNADLLTLLGSLNICSKEWVIRQYDHEVQGGSVVKPLTGVDNDGPSDAAVIAPVLGSTRGLAIACGINPRYGDFDPYWMAAGAVDEAVRNLVAVGADPARIALLDNFCWGSTDRSEVLGSLVRAAEGCRDAALAFDAPFISGKDSLNNEFKSGEQRIAIPPTLLISGLGIVPDIRRAVTMDLKEPGNLLYLVGTTQAELGGSHYHLIHGLSGGEVPQVDFDLSPRIMRAMHRAIGEGLVRACHDLSEGGLAVALAEMCFAGGWGASIDAPNLTALPEHGEAAALFSESHSRFVVEVAAANEKRFADCLSGLPVTPLGRVTREPRLIIHAPQSRRSIIDLGNAEMKSAWQAPLHEG